MQPPPAHLGLAGGCSFSPSLFAALRSRWTRFLGKELGPPPPRRLTLAKSIYHLTHQHVNARSLDPCSTCLSPSRLASILPVPTEPSQSEEAWSSRRLDCGDGVGERLGAKQTCPPRKNWRAERAFSFSLLFCRRHHGPGCGWGGAGGAAVEMTPLPTL